MPGYEGMRVLVPGDKGMSAGVRGYLLVPGDKGMSAGVRGNECRGTRV